LLQVAAGVLLNSQHPNIFQIGLRQADHTVAVEPMAGGIATMIQVICTIAFQNVCSSICLARFCRTVHGSALHDFCVLRAFGSATQCLLYTALGQIVSHVTLVCFTLDVPRVVLFLMGDGALKGGDAAVASCNAASILVNVFWIATCIFIAIHIKFFDIPVRISFNVQTDGGFTFDLLRILPAHIVTSARISAKRHLISRWR
jgi:hypothetical protein